MIRHAALTDLPGLLLLETLCFTEDRMSSNSYRHLLKSPSAEILIIETNGNIQASAVIFFRKNSRTARIYSLAVHPNARRLGLAAELCTALETAAKARHCTSIILEVRPDNAPAIRFYEKHGYTLFGKFFHFYEDGSDALRMRKTL